MQIHEDALSGAGDEVGERVDVPDGFEVRCQATANWVVRKVVAARAYGERVAQWAALESRRAAAEERDLLGRFGQQLEGWARSELTARHGGRRKSLRLPGGTVGFRASPVTVAVADPVAATEWALAHLPASVRVQVTISGDMAYRVIDALHPLGLGPAVRTRLGILDLRGHFTSTGEVPPGVTVVPSSEQFFVR